MLEMANIEFIRKQYYVKGKSIRQISRETGYARQTVRKAIDSTEIPKYQMKEPKPKPVIDSVKEIIVAWLKEDENAPQKQKHSARRIYERLVDEYDFTGGESTIRRYVRELKKHLSITNGYIPLEYQPGDYAQFDWGEAYIDLNGQRSKVQMFCMRLPNSRKIFVKAFPHQRIEAVLQGHADAFQFFGAVPKIITYDNLSTVVKKVLKGKQREEQTRFTQFRAHYLFDTNFCEPGKGHQKGQVERLVKIARDKFFVPLPSVTSLDELNEILLEQCRQYDQGKIPNSNETVGEAFLKEQPYMLPLPPFHLNGFREISTKANTYAMVRFENNAYSVPIQYARCETLTLRAHVDFIEILSEDQVIAKHLRSYEVNQEILNYDHYLDLLLIRPGAIPHARPLKQAKLPIIYEIYRKKLLRMAHGSKEFIQILLLHREFNAELVEKALLEAADKEMYSYDAVRHLLYQSTLPTYVMKPGKLSTHTPIVNVTPPNIQQFDQLLVKGGVIH